MEGLGFFDHMILMLLLIITVVKFEGVCVCVCVGACVVTGCCFSAPSYL